MKYLGLLILFMGVLVSQGSEPVKYTEIVGFADQLFNDGDYYRAITEYKRYQYLSGGSNISEMQYRVALAYYMGGKHEEARQIFRELILSSGDESLANDSRLMIADSYFQSGDYRGAISSLQELSSCVEDESLSIKIGWCELNAGDAVAAKKTFDSIDWGAQQDLAGSLMSHTEEYNELSTKSPFLAGSLSALLPGAGQAYNGRWRDAAVALVINGLTIWSAVEAFDNDENVAGAFATFFEVGWYSGNIYNAVSGAHKYNDNTKSKFLRKIRIQYGLTVADDKDKRLKPVVGLNLKY